MFSTWLSDKGNKRPLRPAGCQARLQTLGRQGMRQCHARANDDAEGGDIHQAQPGCGFSLARPPGSLGGSNGSGFVPQLHPPGAAALSSYQAWPHPAGRLTRTRCHRTRSNTSYLRPQIRCLLKELMSPSSPRRPPQLHGCLFRSPVCQLFPLPRPSRAFGLDHSARPVSRRQPLPISRQSQAGPLPSPQPRCPGLRARVGG